MPAVAFAPAAPVGNGDRLSTHAIARNHSERPRGTRVLRTYAVSHAKHSLCMRARDSAVREGAASDVGPELKELFRRQLANPIFDVSATAAPAVAVQAQQAQPPRFLTARDVDLSSPGAKLAVGLGESRTHILSAARQAIQENHPGIQDKGGALWPEFRAEACWRDLENFVRVVSYGCLCREFGSKPYLSKVGCEIMLDIYHAMEVPMDAMLTGVRACKTAALATVRDDAAACNLLTDAFDEMLQMLEQMAQQSRQP